MLGVKYDCLTVCAGPGSILINTRVQPGGKATR